MVLVPEGPESAWRTEGARAAPTRTSTSDMCARPACPGRSRWHEQPLSTRAPVRRGTLACTTATASTTTPITPACTAALPHRTRVQLMCALPLSAGHGCTSRMCLTQADSSVSGSHTSRTETKRVCWRSLGAGWLDRAHSGLSRGTGCDAGAAHFREGDETIDLTLIHSLFPLF